MANLIKRKPLILLLIVIFGCGLFSFRLNQSIVFHPDLGRDVYEIHKITEGRMTLVGPKLSFGGLYLGPYYFYLFVPVYFIFGQRLLAIHYFNLLLFVVAIGYSVSRINARFGSWEAMIAGLCLIFLPIIIITSRNPSNTASFIPLLLILLTSLYSNQERRRMRLGLLGLLFGLIVNFHFVNLILLPGLSLFIYSYLKEKRGVWFFIAGMMVSFLPLVIFEMRHQL